MATTTWLAQNSSWTPNSIHCGLWCRWIQLQRSKTMQHQAYQPVLPCVNKYLQYKWDKNCYEMHRNKVKWQVAGLGHSTIEMCFRLLSGIIWGFLLISCLPMKCFFVKCYKMIWYAVLGKLLTNCNPLLIPNDMTKIVISNVIHYITHFR